MEHKRISIIVSILLLILLSACEMGTPTPIVLVPTGLVPTTPVVLVPTGLAPACVPSVPSIDQVYAFCANQAAKVGGASFVSGWGMTEELGANCQNNATNTTCTGTPGTTMQVMVCSNCVVKDDLHLPLSDYACPSGSDPMWDGINYGCVKGGSIPTPGAPLPPFCPSGDHYDNNQQNCVDNVTEKVVPDTVSQGCPAGYPYYDLFYNVCTKKPLNLYNCQTFSVPLGECITPVHKIPNAKKCTTNPMTGAVTCQ